jgi:hypothetical protein
MPLPAGYRLITKTPDEVVAGNAETETLYIYDFNSGQGKYFNFYADDFLLSKQIRIKVTVGYIKEKDDINRVVLEKFKLEKGSWVKTEEKIAMSGFNFETLMSFVLFLKGLDLKGISEKKLKLADESFVQLNEEVKKKITTLLQTEDGERFLLELISKVTSEDVVNIGFRKKSLEIFSKLLDEEKYYLEYGRKENLTDLKEEKVWQYFFKENQWIFGYGLDYKYLGILQGEANIGTPDLANRDSATVDFLVGCSKYTVIVEVKKPNTPLFAKNKNRSGSWCLTSDLIHAVSQILEQKAEWQIKSQVTNYASSEETIKQKTVDPKTILIIGRLDKLKGSEKEKDIKQRTFELYRRDSRNIEIMTYEELYERARFIINNKQ